MKPRTWHEDSVVRNGFRLPADVVARLRERKPGVPLTILTRAGMYLADDASDVDLDKAIARAVKP